jgi:hypothetical protein
MTDTPQARIETLRGIVAELKDRVTAEPGNGDLPPLLATAESELATAEAAAKEAEQAASAAAAASAASAASNAPTAPAASPARPRAGLAAPPSGIMPQSAPRPSFVAGNVTADDHPSRLPPAARPTPAGPSSR